MNRTCKNFTSELASKSPVPGGGGACAYVGVLGTALLNMVGNLTVGKKKYKDVEEEVKEILKAGEHLIERLENLVEEDEKVFYPLSKAYGLSKNTEEEKLYKEKIMEEALKKASLVPLKVAKCAKDAIKLHERLSKIGTRIAISDVGVGVLFCKSCLEGAKLNVLINTTMIKDLEFKTKLEKEINEIVLEYVPRADRTYKYVEGLITGGN